MHILRRFWLPALLVCYTFLAASTLVGEHGLLHLWQLRQEQRDLEAQVFALIRENEELRSRLLRLQTDNEFFEKVAREELKVARKGEIIYLFQDPVRVPTP
jgi:cell division protein FtsB